MPSVNACPHYAGSTEGRHTGCPGPSARLAINRRRVSPNRRWINRTAVGCPNPATGRSSVETTKEDRLPQGRPWFKWSVS